MKKRLIAVLTVMAMLASVFAVFGVIAGAGADSLAWNTWDGSQTKNEYNDADGNYFRFTNFATNYNSPKCEVLDKVKTLIGANESADIKIKLEYRGNMAIGQEATKANLRFRWSGDTLLNNDIAGNSLTFDGTWRTFEKTVTVTKTDIAQLTSLYICFSGMNGYENLDSVDVKLPALTIQTAAGTVWKPWSKSQTEIDNGDYSTFKGFPTNYDSPTYEVLDKVKTLIGANESADIKIKLEYRGNMAIGQEATKANLRFRWSGDTSLNNDIAGNSLTFDGTWRTFEKTVTVTKTDIAQLTSLYICFSGMSGYENLDSIDVKLPEITLSESGTQGGQTEPTTPTAWTPWDKSQIKTENGEYDTFTVFASNYNSPKYEVLSTLTGLMQDKSSIDCNIRFEYRGTMKASIDAAKANFRFRWEGNTALANEIATGSIVFDGTWQTLDKTVTVTKDDIKELTSLYMCFSGISDYQNLASIDVKTPSITVVQKQEGGEQEQEQTAASWTGWDKSQTVANVTENGKSFTRVSGGFTTNYNSPKAEVLDKVRELLKNGNGDMTVQFSYRAALKDEADASKANLRFRFTGETQLKNEIATGTILFDGQWHELKAAVSLTDADVKDLTSLYICFSSMSGFENIDAIELTDVMLSAATVEQAPSEAKLSWTGWDKSQQKQTVTENGKTFSRFASGFTTNYNSPQVEILSTVRDMMGKAKSVTLTIAFSYRGTMADDGESKANLRFRWSGNTELANSLADGKIVFDGQWQEFSKTVTITADDIKDIKSLQICFSNMAGYEDIESIDVEDIILTAAGNSKGTGDGLMMLPIFAFIAALAFVAVTAKKRTDI